MLRKRVFLGPATHPSCMHQMNGSLSKIVHCIRLSVVVGCTTRSLDCQPWPRMLLLLLQSDPDALHLAIVA